MLINLLEEKGDKAGIKTLEWLESRIEMAIASGEEDIVVDFSGMSINENFIPRLGKIQAKYHVDFVGLGHNKEENIEAYVGTGYFVKEYIGVEKYTDWLIDMIKIADYPLMIMDTRVSMGEYGHLGIVQPLHFQGQYLVFRKLKSAYMEPHLLERAVIEKKDIWIMDSMHKVDIADKNTGLRFACNLKERTILDLFEGILNREYSGFSEAAVR